MPGKASAVALPGFQPEGVPGFIGDGILPIQWFPFVGLAVAGRPFGALYKYNTVSLIRRKFVDVCPEGINQPHKPSFVFGMTVIWIFFLPVGSLTQRIDFAVGDHQRHALFVDPSGAGRPDPDHERYIQIIGICHAKWLTQIFVKRVTPGFWLQLIPFENQGYAAKFRTLRA